MAHSRGRPALNQGFNTTIRLNDTALQIVDQGAGVLAASQHSMVSRSAWIRYLLDQTLARRTFDALVTTESLKEVLALVTEHPPCHKLTIKLEERHRVILRQFECYAQSLDWHAEVYRNEALLLLICIHGKPTNLAIPQKKGLA